MKVTLQTTAKRLSLHPYLVALGYALLSAPSHTREEEAIRAAWQAACERYGFDIQTRGELLIDIASGSPPVEPS